MKKYFHNLLWELRQYKQLGVPFVLLWQFLTFPFRLRGFLLRRLLRKNPGFSYHEYLWSVSRRLHLPEFIPFRIEATIFQNPRKHESKVSEYLIKTKGELFVDVGANLGRYTILLKPNYKRVIAIEPEPNNMYFLKRNVQEVGLLKNIEFIQRAVCNKSSIAKLYLGRHAGGHTLKSGYYEKYVVVKTITLDELLKDEHSIDLVKADVEGFEWQVLAGAKKIMPRVKSWMIELHDLNRKEELENLMKSFNYRVKWLDKNHLFASREVD